MPDVSVTFEDLRRIARDEILVNQGRITLSAIERQGSDANVVTASAAGVGDEIVRQLSIHVAGQYLDSARGAALDRLCYDRYSMLRKPAAPSYGTVRFYTQSPSPASFAIPVGTVVQTADGVQFATRVGVQFPLNGTEISVGVKSLLAGASQNAARLTISSILSQFTNSPSDLRVQNLNATSGAADEEEDEDLRDRAKRFFTTARRGTLAAIEAGALAIPGVRRAQAIEGVSSDGLPSARVELVIADAFTEKLINSTSSAYDTQSNEFASVVLAALSDVRPAGIPLFVVPASVTLISMRLSLAFYANVSDTTAVADKARAALVRYTNSLQPGNLFSRTNAISALRQVDGLVVSGNEITSPVGDVIPQTREALRTSQSLIQLS